MESSVDFWTFIASFTVIGGLIMTIAYQGIKLYMKRRRSK